MPKRSEPARGSNPRHTPPVVRRKPSRAGDDGNPFVEGLGGIGIVALVALASLLMGGVLAVSISLLY